MSATLCFKVEGMTCAGCESTLVNVLQSTPGVASVAASHRWKFLEVQPEPNWALQIENLRKTIVGEVSDCGFDIKPIDSLQTLFKTEQKPPSPKRHITGFMVNGLLALTWSSIQPMLLLANLSMGTGFAIHALALGIMAWTGKEYYQDAWAKLKAKRTSMNSLIALSTVIAWSLSLLGVLVPSLFASAAFSLMSVFMIMGITNLGRSVRAYQEQKASQLIKGFDDLFQSHQPKTAKKLASRDDSRPQQIPFSLIKPGDIIQVNAGDTVPVDGKLLSSKACLNQKILSGESYDKTLGKGDKIYAGSKNKDQSILIEACCQGADNTLMKILHSARKSQVSHASVERLDTIIQYFVPAVIGIALLSMGGWLLAGSSALNAFNAMTSVLLCACPCALGLAAPLSQGLAIYKMLNRGILVKDAHRMQLLDTVDTLVFDKTGTLSEPTLNQTWFAKRASKAQQAHWLSKAASVEQHFAQSSPIAQAIASTVSHADRVVVEGAKRDASGQGVQGEVDGQRIRLGSIAWLSQSVRWNKATQNKIDAFSQKGYTPVGMCVDDQLVAVFALQHQLKPHVNNTLKELSKQFELILLTGDNASVTKSMVEGLPFTQVVSERMPNQKTAFIESLNKQGKKIAYIGDGLNDIEASQRCEMSIAIQAWTQLATVADVALKGDIRDLKTVIDMNRLMVKNIRENVLWALGYNTISLATASGMLYPLIGFTLDSVIFAATMSVSSIAVLLNAMRLPAQLDNIETTPRFDAKTKPQPTPDKPMLLWPKKYRVEREQDLSVEAKPAERLRATP